MMMWITVLLSLRMLERQTCRKYRGDCPEIGKSHSPTCMSIGHQRWRIERRNEVLIVTVINQLVIIAPASDNGWRRYDNNRHYRLPILPPKHNNKTELLQVDDMIWASRGIYSPHSAKWWCRGINEVNTGKWNTSNGD